MASDMNSSLMDQRGKNFRINGDRLWDSLMEMAKIGPGVAGGNNRQTLTDEDAEGRADGGARIEALIEDPRVGVAPLAVCPVRLRVGRTTRTQRGRRTDGNGERSLGQAE